MLHDLNLSIHELATILGESSTLRVIVARKLSPTPTILEIEGIVRRNGKDKIQAIKDVRSLGDPRRIYSAFPELQFTHSGADSMGLADSKKLVEHVAHKLGIY